MKHYHHHHHHSHTRPKVSRGEIGTDGRTARPSSYDPRQILSYRISFKLERNQKIEKENKGREIKDVLHNRILLARPKTFKTGKNRNQKRETYASSRRARRLKEKKEVVKKKVNEVVFRFSSPL